jgi:two-component system sensor histidine kinase BaeS
MISDIAHELKTPLTALSVNLENLADGADASSAARAATLMDEVTRLNRLVSDLQLLSLADDGALRLSRQSTDLSLLLHRVVDLTAPAAEDEGVSLSLAAGEAVTADVDPDRITQATLNLITNALQHVPPGGSIEVSLDTQRSAGRAEAVITVADTGSGIPTEALSHVFDRFYRADQSRHRPGGGSGLGLAIVHSLAQAHGGRAWAESEAGRGARFHIALPLDAMDIAPDNL